MNGPHPSGCACCAVRSPRTPAPIWNRPGLPAIDYRTGTHAAFMRSLLDGLAAHPALGGLRTRAGDDPTVALLDAFATAADVLTFYQERIANELYLRTAVERRSVIELAAAIGYRPRPGVAAATYLAFMMDDVIGSVRRTLVPAGAAVQSIPAPGQTAVTYETVEAIEARVEWNALQPRVSERHPLPLVRDGRSYLYVQGTTANLRPGDALLFRDGAAASVLALVVEAVAEPEHGRTRVQIDPVGGAPVHDGAPNAHPPLPAVSGVAAAYVDRGVPAADLTAAAARDGFSIDDLFTSLRAARRPPPEVLVFRARAAVFGHNAPAWSALPPALRGDEPRFEVKAGKVESTRLVAGPFKDRRTTWADADLKRYLDFLDTPPPDPHAIQTIVDALLGGAFEIVIEQGQTFFIEGQPIKPGVKLGIRPPKEKPVVLANSARTDVHLDAVYQNITPGGFAVLKAGATWGVYGVKAVADVSLADFTLSAKVTRLTLDSNAKLSSFPIRTTTVFVQSEALMLARAPVEEPFPSAPFAPLRLETWTDGLRPGQGLAITGELAGEPGVRAAEYAEVDTVTHVLGREGGTEVTLRAGLRHRYVRASVRINANVARASHGEARREPLGSGDATRTYQRFTLQQPPLTYLSAATGDGVASTLEVWVDGLRWQETDTLTHHGPEDQVYVTSRLDDGRTVVMFGDGRTGARLPTGRGNVTARYRRGLGTEGAVAGGQLSLLLTRPLGLGGVTNPEPSSSGDDPESRDDARRNAPLQVMTLGRVVSLRDYEDFARAFGGVAKALAVWVRAGERPGIHITVAGPRGTAVSDTGPGSVYRNLLDQLQAAGDPFVPLRLASYTPAFFRLRAAVRLDPARPAEGVKAAVADALRTAFGFAARSFGQPVTQGEVVATIQRVPGVVAVDLLALHRTGVTPGARPEDVLTAAAPRPGAAIGVAPAELLLLDPSPVAVEEGL